MGTLKDKVAIVTGAGRGIGRQVSIDLASESASLVLAGLRKGSLQETNASLSRLRNDTRTLAVVADVGKEEDVQRLTEEAAARFGKIDILINNAAVAGPTAPASEISIEEWNAVIQTNLTGAFLCCREVIPFMKKQGYGKIINIASIAGKIAYPLRSPYAVSKWGLLGLNQTLAAECASSNIQVNAICPGPVKGQRMKEIINARAKQLGTTCDDVEATYVSTTALKRMVTEKEVSALVLYLLSDAASGITGEAIDITAGYRL